MKRKIHRYTPMPDEARFDWFHMGLLYKIPICCILFFCFEWWTIKEEIPEYSKFMKNKGIIKCPLCIAKQILN